MPTSAAVITVSDRSSSGERPDTSGPIAVAALREAGYDCADAAIVPDGADSVERALRAALAAGARVIVTTGGTGVAPRDQTPEGTLPVLHRPIPGIAEELRRRGAEHVASAVLTRGVAGIAASDAGGALVVNLPGSTGGVRDGMPVIIELAPHVLDQLGGGDHR
ncbi:MogA/MoaB family molybdenum cofactor biosynthesis protein [Microbacter sp. GSS18]|nr:MogA/MoaB family molybdenum cofactor biosynthesis protein [Microbacter sp. GSS18]